MPAIDRTAKPLLSPLALPPDYNSIEAQPSPTLSPLWRGSPGGNGGAHDGDDLAAAALRSQIAQMGGLHASSSGFTRTGWSPPPSPPPHGRRNYTESAYPHGGGGGGGGGGGDFSRIKGDYDGKDVSPPSSPTGSIAGRPLFLCVRRRHVEELQTAASFAWPLCVAYVSQMGASVMGVCFVGQLGAAELGSASLG